KVVDKIGDERILDPKASQRWALTSFVSNGSSSIKSFIKGLVTLGDSDAANVNDPAIARHYKAVKMLANSIDISAPRESTVVSISANAPTPELAQQIVKTWTDVFLAEHLRLTNTEGSFDFFVEQRELLRGELQAAQESLRKTKDENQLATIDGQRVLLESLKSEVDVERFRNSRQVGAAEARCADLKKSFAELPDTVLTARTDGISDEAHDGMRQQLYELEIRERELLERYEAGHPLVEAIQRQVKNVRHILEDQEESERHTTYAANPARATLKVELIQAEAELAALGADADSLAQQHGEIVQRFRDLNEYAVTIRQMERQVELLDTSYRLYSEKSEQARINDAMASQQITSVRVMQAATFDPDSVGQSRTALLGAGIIMAFFGACGVALLLESLDRSVRSPQETEEALDLPVLVTIPKSSRQLVRS
ncbi:MAG: hypothetical protein OES79_14845, partial [Planctomycetota bacterium]|nr:hypothetical protein [Planctomycetota bacterium]